MTNVPGAVPKKQLSKRLNSWLTVVVKMDVCAVLASPRMYLGWKLRHEEED